MVAGSAGGGLVHTNTFSFENASFSLCFGLPSTLRQRLCQGQLSFLKTSFDDACLVMSHIISI